MQQIKNHFGVVIVAILVALLPLISTSGRNFEYEYAFAVGILSIICFPMLSFVVPSAVLLRWRESSFVLEVFYFSVIILVTSAISYASFRLLSCPCSENGLLFWLAVTVAPSMFVAFGFMKILGWLRLQEWSLVRRIALWIGFLLLVLGIEGAFLWIGPQKRMTSLLLSHLHGPIYDNLILLDMGVVWKRAAALALGLAMIAVVGRQQFEKFIAAFLMIACLVAIGFSLRFPTQSFGTKALTRHLNRTIQTDQFDIHYRSEKAEIPEAIKKLKREAGFHLFELMGIFHINSSKKIHIFAYENESDKKLFFGGGATDVTDVVTPSIHILQSNEEYRSLRHELVHAFTSSFAFHGLGFHPNMAFTEGLAVAFAPEEQMLSLHESAATLFDSGKIENPTDLFSPLGFYLNSGARSYAAAGSLILFIKEKFGIEKVIAIYSGGATEKVLGVSKRELAAMWLDHLKTRVDLEAVRLKGDKFFREPSVFSDRCPHSKIDLRVEASNDFFAKARQPLRWKAAEDYPKWFNRLEPGQHDTVIATRKNQIHECLKRNDQRCLKDTYDTLRKENIETLKTIDDAERKIILIDLAMILGDVSYAQKNLQQLNSLTILRKFHDALARQIQVRSMIVTEKGQRGDWFRYLAGWSDGLPEQKLSNPSLDLYLRMRRMKDSDLLTEAEGLKKARIDNHLSKEVLFEWNRFTAEAAYRNDRFDLAAFFGQRAVRYAKDYQLDLTNLKLREYVYVQNSWKHL